MRFALVIGLALVFVGGAAAAGGTTIASAPLIRPGVPQSEDTSVDRTRRGEIGSALSRGCWNDFEFWRLPLTAGDRVTITGKARLSGYDFAVGVFPAGTTDRNLNARATVLNAFTESRAGRFTARTTGIYPLVVGPNCYDGSDGPFSFVVAVAHAK